jgi:DNA-binding HxlR family transcriptional regulator
MDERSSMMQNELVVGIDPIIQDAIISLKERTDFALIAMLISSESLSFSEILAELRINPTALDRTLDRLMNVALVNNFYAKKAESKKHSFYEATTLAKVLFQKLRELQEVKRESLPWTNRFYTPGSKITPVGSGFKEVMERCDYFYSSLSKQLCGRTKIEIIE